eukprot:20917-Heterococcus_DN1.PRE.2
MSVLQRVCAAGITSAAAYASFKITTSSDKQVSAVLPVIRAQEPAPVPNDAVPADSVLMPKPVQSARVIATTALNSKSHCYYATLFTAAATATYENIAEPDDNGCAWCAYMKGGPSPCPLAFTNWRKCVSVAQSNGDDMVQACRIATDALSKCMQTHSDYYGTENEDDEPDSPDQEPVSNAETSKSAAATKEQP